MSFRFRSAVIYDRVQFYARDLYNLTNRFPDFEKEGLIREIRDTCTKLVQETAAVLNKPKGQEETKEAFKTCVNIISHLVALFDFAHHLEYIADPLHERAIKMSEDITKYVYEAKDSHGKS